MSESPKPFEGEDELAFIESRDYWVRVVDFLQIHWALIEREGPKKSKIYFLTEVSGIFDEVVCHSTAAAEALLESNEFSRFSENVSVSMFDPPPPPFWRREDGFGGVYTAAAAEAARDESEDLRDPNASATRLTDLLAYVFAEGRVAPMPCSWDGLWQLVKRRGPDGEWQPLTPLILGASSASRAEKRARVRQQLEFAAAVGALRTADRFLRSLAADEWECD